MRLLDTSRLGVTLVVLLTLCGCQNQNDNDAVEKNEEVKQQSVRFLTEIVEALESVNDKASAKAAAARINETTDEIESYHKRAKDIPPISQSENDRLKKKYQSQFDELSERMKEAARSAGTKCEEEPSLMKAMERMSAVADKL